MKKMMNKKGFTLVELLAVIVILAVIILVAMNAVIPQMEKARKSAFKTEAETYLKAAQTYYTSSKIDGSAETCVTIDTLNNGYITKADDSYEGYVLMGETTDDFKIALTNDEYSIGAAGSEMTLSEVADLDVSSLPAASSAITSTCP